MPISPCTNLYYHSNYSNYGVDTDDILTKYGLVGSSLFPDLGLTCY